MMIAGMTFGGTQSSTLVVDPTVTKAEKNFFSLVTKIRSLEMKDTLLSKSISVLPLSLMMKNSFTIKSFKKGLGTKKTWKRKMLTEKKKSLRLRQQKKSGEF